MTTLIKKLPVDRWREYRALRLQALSECPFAFEEDYRTAVAQPDAGWQDVLRERNMYFAESDGTLVGLAGFFRKDSIKVRHVLVVVGVYVAPALRGQGVAQQLITAIIQAAREMKGIRKINLAVTSPQRPAFELYKKLGFVQVGTRKDQLYVGDRFFDEFLMEKYL